MVITQYFRSSKNENECEKFTVHCCNIPHLIRFWLNRIGWDDPDAVQQLMKSSRSHIIAFWGQQGRLVFLPTQHKLHVKVWLFSGCVRKTWVIYYYNMNRYIISPWYLTPHETPCSIVTRGFVVFCFLRKNHIQMPCMCLGSTPD